MYDKIETDFREATQYTSWEKVLTASENKLVVITGAPGDGKTSFAIRASHSLKNVLYFEDVSLALRHTNKPGTVIILDNVFLLKRGEQFKDRSQKISGFIKTIKDLENSRLVLICNIFDLNKYNHEVHDDPLIAALIDMTDAYTKHDIVDFWFDYKGPNAEDKIEDFKGFGFPQICSYAKDKKLSFEDAVRTHYKTEIMKIIEPRGVRLAMFASVFSFEHTQHGTKSFFDILHERYLHGVSKKDAKVEADYFKNIFFSDSKLLETIIQEACFFAFHELFPRVFWQYLKNVFQSPAIGNMVHSVMDTLYKHMTDETHAESAVSHLCEMGDAMANTFMEKYASELDAILQFQNSSKKSFLYWTACHEKGDYLFGKAIEHKACNVTIQDALRSAIIDNKTAIFRKIADKLQELHIQFHMEGLLCFAVETGATGILKYLLEKKTQFKCDVTKCLKLSPADLKDLRCLCKSPVHIGIIHDIDEAVLLLLNESYIYSSQEHLNSSLLWACIRGRTTIFDKLLDKNADKEFLDENSWTPLMWSCAAGMAESVRKLIEQGADINRINSEGDTPLIIACKFGSDIHTPQLDDVVSALLGNMDVNNDGQKNTVNVVGNNRYTALMWASKHGRNSTVKLLLEKGGDETVINTNGETALMLAVSGDHRSVQYELLYKDRCGQFVVTAGYKKARDILKHGNLLILAGRPGEGKTTLALKLCYDYCQEGYNRVVYEKGQNIDLHELEVETKTILVGDNYTDYQNTVEAISNTNPKSRKFILIEKYQNRTLTQGHYSEYLVDINKINEEHPEDHLSMLKLLDIKKTEKELKDIVSKSPSCIAFPKAVQLYRKYKHCVDPVTYFTYPLHYFIGEMENMAETSDMEEWVYLLLGGGNCDDDDDEVVRAIQQRFPLSAREVKKRLRQYIGGYLEYTIEGPYFSHPAIYDACLFVVDKKYPGFLWEHCMVEFVREEEQSHNSLTKLTVFISKHNTPMFLTQIVEDLEQGKFRHSLSHGVFRAQENIDRLFTQLGDRMKDIVKAEDDSGSFLYWVAQSDNQDLMKAVLDKPDLSQADVNRALIDCIKTNQSKPFHLLRGELMNKIGHNLHYNSDLYSLLMASAETDNSYLVDVIVRDMDDLQLKNKDGNTALHLVCLTGNTEVVKYIFNIRKMSKFKDLPGQDLRTPVMMAALKGNSQLYTYLADVEKCQLTGVDENGDTILNLACVGGNLNIVKQLVTGGIIDKNQRGQHGKTPLMIAAYCKHKEMFDWLVGQKCDISPLDFSINNLVSYGGVNHSTSLHVFLNSRELGIINKDLEYGRTKLLVKHLESKGSNMLFKDASGMSQLHTAANTGHLGLMDFLLSKGNVDINIRDGRGRTPVMLAAAGGHGQMFKDLLGRGTDLSLKDEMFSTPLSYAVETGDKQICNTVLNRDGDMSVVDRDKNTLLHLACKGGNLDIVRHILSLGMFDIDAVNRERRTPLLVAAYSGHKDVCHHLICVGADLHIHDSGGNDVLLAAADQGHFSLAKYMLSQESKGHAYNKDKSGKTAPMKAAEKGHHEVFRVMMYHGEFDLSTIDHKEDNILHHASIGGNVDIVEYILSQNIVDKNSTDRSGRTSVMKAAEKGHRGVFDLLVKEGCYLSVVDSNGDNILHVACIGGNVDIVKYIISHNIVNINVLGSGGRTPVMMAAENRHKGVFGLLLRERCDLSVVDSNRVNILHVACIGGNADIVKYILSHNIVDINSRNRFGGTPVMMAAENGHREVLDLLVRDGCHLSAVDRDGGNILHVACIRGNVDIVKYLLSQNIVDINTRDWLGRTPVMRAAENGHRGVTDILVREGCDLSVVDRYNGDNILHVACIGGNVYSVKHILSENTVDINSRGSSGRTPVMMAAENGHREVFDLLVREGCDLSVVDSNGGNILHVACIGGNVDIVKYILSQTIVAINSRDWLGRTPVMRAAENGHRGVTDMLVREGCDLSVVDRDGGNILHVACIRGNVDIVKYILSQNIGDINSRDMLGRTPVMRAAENGHRGVIEFLVREGCDLSVVDRDGGNVLHCCL